MQHLDEYVSSCQEPDTRAMLCMIKARREFLLLIDALGADRAEELLLVLFRRYRDHHRALLDDVNDTDANDGNDNDDSIYIDRKKRASAAEAAARKQRATWAAAHLSVLASRATSPLFPQRCARPRDSWLQKLANSQEDDPRIARTWCWVLRHALYVVE